jgi:hypothetical protein
MVSILFSNAAFVMLFFLSVLNRVGRWRAHDGTLEQSTVFPQVFWDLRTPHPNFLPAFIF